MFVVSLLVDVVFLALFAFAPVMRGEDAFFGVRVSPETFRGEGRRLVRRYRFWLVMTFIEIEAIGLLVAGYKGQMESAQVVLRLLVFPVATLLYVIFYRQAKQLEMIEEHQRFASSLKTRKLADYTNLPLEVVIAALTIAPVLILVYFYSGLPERIPVHWNWKGEPDGWTRKSYFA